MRKAGVLYLDKTEYADDDLANFLRSRMGLVQWSPGAVPTMAVYHAAFRLFNKPVLSLDDCKKWVDDVLRTVDTRFNFIKKTLVEIAREVHTSTDFASALTSVTNTHVFLENTVLLPFETMARKERHATKIQALWRGYTCKKKWLQCFVSLFYVDDGWCEYIASRVGGDFDYEIFKDGRVQVPRSFPGWKSMTPEWTAFFDAKAITYHYLVNLFGETIENMF